MSGRKPSGRDADPSVSIVVVNYDGERFLPACLDSLARLDYPADRYEVVLVDNGSRDGSLDLVRRCYPVVRIVEHATNEGYCAGNNAGIRAATGELVVLLNNDTHVERDWLRRLVEAAAADPRIGIVTSRIRLTQLRLELRLSCRTFVPEPLGGARDTRRLGACIAAVEVNGERREVDWLDGFYAPEHDASGVYRWTRETARLGIPVEPGETHLGVRIVEAPHRPPPAGPAVVRVDCAGDGLLESPLVGSIELELGARHLAKARPVVQNSGSVVFRNGASRDRGAVVGESCQYYETDIGQYDRREEVFAACGASMLLRRQMLEDVGLLEPSFFMYYEDTDLSWRARSRGWKVVYAPESIVWHVHCGSSGEWSPLFLFYTDRNRLLLLARNAEVVSVVREWLRYLLGTLRDSARAALPGGSPADGRRAVTRWRVLGSLALHLPGVLRQRRRIHQRRLVGRDEIERWLRPVDA